ncbi:ead/Ea22-like family protein [Salmonella enterica]
MSNLDKQALRESAERAKHAGKAPVMHFDARITALNEFQKQFTPVSVLALLDELEAAEKHIAELEAQTVNIPEVRITVAESKRKNLTWRELGAYNEGADVAKETILAVILAAGIGVKRV